ncbi:MAG: DUF1552 domain-containing protein [Nannocystaceae bacterium]|nr:DUF1552 domain-containing protein [Nannocystaceae bacterium]
MPAAQWDDRRRRQWRQQLQGPHLGSDRGRRHRTGLGASCAASLRTSCDVPRQQREFGRRQWNTFVPRRRWHPAGVPINSPRQLFESLFNGFVPPGADPAQLAELEYQQRRTSKVVDLVKGDADRLIARLGGEDRRRMERHLTAISEFEDALGQQGGGGSECVLPANPGDDPPIGSSTTTSSPDDYDTTAAWSDEETRALRHTELIHMALTCELTRSVALQYTYAHCWLNMFPVTGHTNDLHELGHGGSGTDASPLEALSDGISWNVRHWARLVDLLKNTPDIDGRSVLDNTAITLMFEGGHGWDPEAAAYSVHSTENMSALIAGGAGGLNASGGRHIAAPGEHPARVLTSAMHAVGAGDTLGEVSGVIPELFA